jgi:pyridoxal phosphate enzyme (YggS family)
MSIANNLRTIQNSLPLQLSLVAVSKTKPITAILEAYTAGQRIFGENKALELAEKAEKLPTDIQWHMIGHLQSNKVKYIAPFVSLIHGVDSIKLLQEIDKRAKQNNRIIDCLLQVHIATENTKFGFGIKEVEKVIEESKGFKNITITGLMAMATFTDDSNQINKEFASISQLFKKVKTKELNTLSIGMSGDYKLAINNGSTMVRIGSAIFGHRN